MTRPRSDDRSGTSSRPGPEGAGPDLAALRRELYRPGADRAALEAYLEAAAAQDAAAVHPEAEPVAAAGPVIEAAAPRPRTNGVPAVGAVPPGRRRPSPRRIALASAVTVVGAAAGLALLPRPHPAPPPVAGASGPGIVTAPTTIDGLRGGSTLLVGVPWRTSRVRIRLKCEGPSSSYGWMALGQDSQTQQFIPVLEHSGDTCRQGASYVGPLPGDVDVLRILITVDGPYAVSVEPL